MSTFTADKVLDLLNETITKDNIDTNKDIIIIINEKLKNDIKDLYDNSKVCKKCCKYFIIEGVKHSWCVPCRKSYKKIYKTENGETSRKSKKYNLDYEKNAHCATCKKTKSITEFYSNNIYRCKKCVSIKSVESRNKKKVEKERYEKIKKDYDNLLKLDT